MTNLPFDPNSLTQVIAVGPDDPKKRPFGKMLRGLGEKGLLSVLLLSQLGQLAMAGPNVPNIPEAGKAQSSMVDIVQLEQETSQARFFNPIDMVLERGQELPESMMQDAGISGIEMVRHWRNMDLKEKTIHELTEVLILAQSPTFVTTKDSYTRAASLAQRTSGIFDIKNQREANRFLKRYSVEKLEQIELLPGGSKDTYVRTFEEDSISNTIGFWDAMGKIRTTDHNSMWEPMEGDTAQTFNEAIENLSQAVGEAGFASVKVPLPMWADSGKLNQLAEDIKQSNNELEQITGWKGQVMGLNGRVNYTIGMPYGMATASLNYYGEANIQSGMNIFGHEWVHALEAVVAYDMGYRVENNPMPMFSMAEEGHSHTHFQTPHSIANVNATLDSKLVNWNEKHKDAESMEEGASLLVSSDYLHQNNERLAYAFGSYLSAVVGDQSPLAETPKTEKSFGPQLEEAILAQQAWEVMFEDIGQEWWGPQMSVKYNMARSLNPEQAQDSPTISASVAPRSHEQVDMAPLPRTRINVAAMESGGEAIFEPRKPIPNP